MEFSGPDYLLSVPRKTSLAAECPSGESFVALLVHVAAVETAVASVQMAQLSRAGLAVAVVGPEAPIYEWRCHRYTDA